MSYKNIFFDSCFTLRIGILVLVALLAGCASSPEIKPVITYQRPKLIDYALSLQGKPYRWGKESPQEGFDCSGFVQHVYRKHGIRLPRTAHDMAVSLPPTPRHNLCSGDLVFFNTRGKRYSHVGIFIYNDKFIHAPNRRIGKVIVSSLNERYWRNHFTGARRPGYCQNIVHTSYQAAND